MIKNIKTRNPFLLFLPFLILYLVLILYLNKNENYGDEIRYLVFANNLIHGFYSPPYPYIDLGNGPGYPLILTPFVALKSPLLLISLMNAVFYYLSVVLLFKSLQRIVSSKFAIIFSIMWALYPNSLEQMTHRLPEIFVSSLIPLLIFAVTNCFRSDKKQIKNYLILAGLTFGFIILTKPIFGYVLVAMILGLGFLWIFNKKNINYKKSFVILVIAFVFALPYLVYTYHLTGKMFYLSSFGGNNLYWMTTPYEGEYGEYFRFPFASNPDRLPGSEEQLKLRHNKDFEELLKNDEVRKANIIDGVIQNDLSNGTVQDELLKKIAWQNIKAHPFKFIQNCISNIGRMIFNYPASYTVQKPSSLRRLPVNGTLMVLVLFCLIPTLISWNKIDYSIRFLLLFALIYFGGSVLGSAETRMFTVIVPILLIWIAFVLERSVKVNMTLEKIKT